MKRQFPYFWSIIDLHTVNLDSPITQLSCAMNILYRGDNLSPRMPCQWYVRGGGEGKRRILIGQSVPPPPLLEWHSDVLSCHLSALSKYYCKI
jgi:hypothetical protein